MNIISAFLSSLGALSLLTTFVTGWVNKKLNIKEGWLKQVVSWIIPILVCSFCFVFQFGIFTVFGPITSVFSWICVLATGFGTGLVSNGIYDIEYIRNIVKEFLVLFEPVENAAKTETNEKTNTNNKK